MVTAFISFVPLIGNAVRGAGVVLAGRMITFIGEVGQVSLDLYALAQDPLNPANIMFIMIDAMTVYLPRWDEAAGAYSKIKTAYRYNMYAKIEQIRASKIDGIIKPNHRYA